MIDVPYAICLIPAVIISAIWILIDILIDEIKDKKYRNKE